MNVGQLIACLHEFDPSVQVAGYLLDDESGGVATGRVTLETKEDSGLYYKGDSPFEFDEDLTELVTIHFEA